ncbi:nucleoredoxin-like protein 1 [Brienomyrus brachyistius]|uniref:nucleoredoxin-like protein 1 n=1 Tax=Brienomyrus brachyistius TaxID=42636 RepID=UPI0020B44DC1|nr:nucleoredoxin-like protein 1 [Brienomyrus brachyistius]
MADLFLDKVLIKNNKDKDELDTEREMVLRLQNRVMMLFFGSGECERCKEFAPTLKDFFKRLTDEFYVERAAQLVLLYISLDSSEKKQLRFLKDMPKGCLFIPFKDSYRMELKYKFNVEEIPTVVVLRPDGSVLSPNAVPEICSHGPGCFRNWQEGAELIDRNFMMAEEFDDTKMRSMTDPLRRLKYKVDKKNKKKRESREEDDDEEEQNDSEEEESSC